MFLQRVLSWRPFSNWRVWLFAIFAGYMYFVEIAPNWTTFRYKMTVVIETPEGVKTGSSVVEYVRRPAPNVYGIVTMLVSLSTREGTLLRAQHWTRGLATIIEIWPAGWVVVPRLVPYGAYRIQPEQLNSRLPNIKVPNISEATAILIPRTGNLDGNLEAAQSTVSSKIKDFAEGVKITSITLRPTSEPLLTSVPSDAPPWVERLRLIKTLNVKRTHLRGWGTTTLTINDIEHGW